MSHSFGGEYLELKPHERIRKTDRFDDPNLPGEMQVTINLKPVSCGTALDIMQDLVSRTPAMVTPELPVPPLATPLRPAQDDAPALARRGLAPRADCSTQR